ncbi:MAG: dockerin type I repeat-containing protein [Christensenellales bacterium]
MRIIVACALVILLALISFSSIAENSTDPRFELSLDKPTVDISRGESITASIISLSNTESYEFLFIWYVTDDGVEEQLSISTMSPINTSSVTPQAGTSGRVVVIANDSDGIGRVAAELSFAIANSFDIIVSLDKTIVDIGKNEFTTLIARPKGGVEPYFTDVTFEIVDDGILYRNLPFGILTQTTEDSYLITPRFGDHGTVIVYARDSRGYTKRIEKSVSFLGAPKCEIALNRESITAGEEITANWFLTGGKPSSYYTIVSEWQITEKSGARTQIRNYDNDGQTSISPLFGVDGKFTVELYDQGAFVQYFSSNVFTISDSMEPLVLDMELDRTTVNTTTGETISVSLSARNGIEPYTFSCDLSYRDEEGTLRLKECGYSIQEDSFQVSPPPYYASGMLEATVSDAVGRYAYATCEFIIVGAADLEPLEVIVSIDKESVDVSKGETITASSSARGGIPPYLYYGQQNGEIADSAKLYRWMIYEKSELILDFFGPDTYKPVLGDRGSVGTHVNDSIKTEAKAGVGFSIIGSPVVDPLHCTISLDRKVVDIGNAEQVSALIEAQGGTPPYSYQYRWYISDENDMRMILNVGSTSSKTSVFVPKYGVLGRVEATVLDGSGRKDELYGYFNVVGRKSAEPLKLIISFDKETTAYERNEEINATLIASGGTGYYTYDYCWFLSENEAETKVLNEYGKLDNSSVFIPEFGISGRLAASVHDSLGSEISAEAAFSINSPIVPPIAGDANGNTEVDIQDLVNIIDYIVSGTSPTSMPNADANGDSRVDIQDLVWIIDQIVGG